MEQAQAIIDWHHTPVQMVESVLRANQPRLAHRYRSRLPALPQLATTLAREIRPVLAVLNPVKDKFSWDRASEAIERSLVHNGVLFEDPGRTWARSRLTGEEIRNLMRLNNVTICELAERMRVTMTRVREVRERGVAGNAYCLDWYEGITRTGLFA